MTAIDQRANRSDERVDVFLLLDDEQDLHASSRGEPDRAVRAAGDVSMQGI